MTRELTLTAVARMIPMLASPIDGEVKATILAIQRRLAMSGLDLHDLAREVAAAGQRGFAPAAPPRSRMLPTIVLRRVREIRDSEIFGSLSPWDVAMLDLIAGHAHAGRALTTSQEETLAKICAKAGVTRETQG